MNYIVKLGTASSPRSCGFIAHSKAAAQAYLLRLALRSPLVTRKDRLGEQGWFGAIAPWVCPSCGPVWREPEYQMTYRQTYFDPEEGESCCPECGAQECEERDLSAPVRFKVLYRYTIHRHSRRSA
jgi:hypothetical protein